MRLQVVEGVFYSNIKKCDIIQISLTYFCDDSIHSEDYNDILLQKVLLSRQYPNLRPINASPIFLIQIVNCLECGVALSFSERQCNRKSYSLIVILNFKGCGLNVCENNSPCKT